MFRSILLRNQQHHFGRNAIQMPSKIRCNASSASSMHQKRNYTIDSNNCGILDRRRDDATLLSSRGGHVKTVLSVLKIQQPSSSSHGKNRDKCHSASSRQSHRSRLLQYIHNITKRLNQLQDHVSQRSHSHSEFASFGSTDSLLKNGSFTTSPIGNFTRNHLVSSSAHMGLLGQHSTMRFYSTNSTNKQSDASSKQQDGAESDKPPKKTKSNSAYNSMTPMERKIAEKIVEPLLEKLSDQEILLKYLRFYKYFFFITSAACILALSLYFALVRESYPDWIVGILRTLDAYLTLFSIIFDYKFSLRGKDELPPEDRYEILSQIHRRSAKKLLDLCFRNGGIYIKAGQFASSLNNVLPIEYCETLQPCQDQVPVQEFGAVRDLICKEMGISDLSEVFSSFTEKAVAAASLAQVYKAKLTSGETVAVKVQHPKLYQTVQADVKVFKKLVALTEYFFHDLKLMWILNEFELHLPEELDFTHEARNNEEFDRLIASKYSNVRTPKIYWEHTHPKVLTMEFIDNGYKVNDHAGLHYLGADVSYLSQLMLDMFSRQIFVEGWCHADMHPGNVLVVKNPAKPKGVELVVLDHGLYTRISEDMKLAYSELWLALIMRDQKKVFEASQHLGVPEDKCELFSVMLTNRSWDSSDVGISSSLSNDEQRMLLQYASENFFNITQVLSEIDRRFLLLLKVNDLLRNMQAFLGVYVNYFSVFAENAQKTVNRHRVNEARKRGFFTSWAVWVRGVYDFMMLKICLWMYMRLKGLGYM